MSSDFFDTAKRFDRGELRPAREATVYRDISRSYPNGLRVELLLKFFEDRKLGNATLSLAELIVKPLEHAPKGLQEIATNEARWVSRALQLGEPLENIAAYYAKLLDGALSNDLVTLAQKSIAWGLEKALAISAYDPVFAPVVLAPAAAPAKPKLADITSRIRSGDIVYLAGKRTAVAQTKASPKFPQATPDTTSSF